MTGPGTLAWRAVEADDPAVAAPVLRGLAKRPDHGLGGFAGGVLVADIDPDLADTAAFCAQYGVAMSQSANCVVVAGRRGDEVRFAACVVLATTRADVNGLVRRRLDARKASFAPVADAVALTGMEFGGITAIGLPAAWPVLIDPAVVAAGTVVVGSGLRRSKLAIHAASLLDLAAAEELDGLAR